MGNFELTNFHPGISEMVTEFLNYAFFSRNNGMLFRVNGSNSDFYALALALLNN